MTTETPDTGEAIKIALASAETASDAASLAEKTSKKLSTKADWVDRKLIPAGIGGLVAMTICAGLSGLVYFRTLSDLRTARDTHVEALHLFTQNVNRLNETVTIAEEMIASQTGERTELAQSLTSITDRMTLLEEQISGSSQAISAALGDGAQGFSSQLAMTMDPKVEVIRDDILAGLADLQVALSQKLSTVANQMMTTNATNQTRVQKPPPTVTAQVTQPKPRPSTTRSTPRAAKPKPPTNPFSFP